MAKKLSTKKTTKKTLKKGTPSRAPRATTPMVPLADRIVIMPVVEEKTVSGIIIPDSAHKERPERGRVVAVGAGRIGEGGKRIPPEVSVGDVVLFAKYGPDEVTIAGVQYYILREDQILAILS